MRRSRRKYTSDLAEQGVSKLAKEGLPVVTANPSAQVGARVVKPIVTGQAIVDFMKGRMPAHTETGASIIDVDDAAAGSLFAIPKGRQESMLPLLLVGMVELFRRSGRLQERYRALPLPIFAVIGGSLLFLHSHHDHPSAHKIALHHLTMGVTALPAGTCLLVSEYQRVIVGATDRTGPPCAGWKGSWGILVLVIGVQLLVYAE